MDLLDIDIMIDEVRETIKNARAEIARNQTVAEQGKRVLKSLEDTRRLLDGEPVKKSSRPRVNGRPSPDSWIGKTLQFINNNPHRGWNAVEVGEAVDRNATYVARDLNVLVNDGLIQRVSRGVFKANDTVPVNYEGSAEVTLAQ